MKQTIAVKLHNHNCLLVPHAKLGLCDPRNLQVEAKGAFA